jgi:biotin operon repressor
VERDKSPKGKEGKKMIKTLEMLKFNKGYYVTARVNGRAMTHEYFKTKTLAMARVKELKKEGYEIEK